MSSIKSLAPYFGMILIQLAYGGSNILCKLALERGLNYLVFIVYRHIIAMSILAPLAYMLERKRRPPISLSIAIKIFMLALFGTTIHQNVYYAGLDYTSPTVACALSGVIPALTFSLAVLLRMEKVKIRKARGWAKIIGTFICITGALLFTFWNGHLLKGFVKRPLIIIQSKGGLGNGSRHLKDEWIKGSVLILVSYVAFSAWLILQGTVVSCLAYYLQTFCISKRGPVFAAMFCPLVLVIVGLFSAFVFAERLHLGSMIGAIVIILGLYTVLWGKSRDSDEDNKCKCITQSTSQQPCDQFLSSSNGCHPV